ncbi:MAG: MCE family protein, partial [Bacteroidetes bacterium]|nr:MCE family protein [Bacteroidota bacterium]
NTKQATAQLNKKDNALGVLLNDPSVASDLKQTLQNLNQGTAKLDTNMEALQHNFLFRGFFKKKKKAEEKAKN